MNKNFICVFDFETDSPDPETCSPVELSALIIHPRQLEVMPDSLFESDIRPLDIDDDNYIEKHQKTIDFHIRATGQTQKQILKRWRNSPLQVNVWDQFKNYLLKYNSNQSKRTVYTAAIPGGQNVDFDITILDRMAKNWGDENSRGKAKVLNNVYKVDTMQMSFCWFESNPEINSCSMDSLREYFGISDEKAHTAIKDVKDTSDLICRYLKLYRVCAEKVKFKNAFKKEKNE